MQRRSFASFMRVSATFRRTFTPKAIEVMRGQITAGSSGGGELALLAAARNMRRPQIFSCAISIYG